MGFGVLINLPRVEDGKQEKAWFSFLQGGYVEYNENQVISAPSDIKKNEQKDDNLPVDIKLPVKHVLLSKELQLYFDKVAELTLNESDSVLFKEALVSLATDSGLHPLFPYFTCFVADEVIVFVLLPCGG